MKKGLVLDISISQEVGVSGSSALFTYLIYLFLQY